jgi:hypothetical protein
MNRIKFNIYFFFKISIHFILSLYVYCLTSFAQGIELPSAHTVFQEPDIFVITNRQIDSSDAKLSFTNNVNKNPSLTFFRVKASSIDSIQLTILDSAAFLSEISEIKKQDWVLYVHGDGKTFEQAVNRGLIIQNTYKIRVIVFSWPSKDLNKKGIENFKNSYQNIEKSINHFISILRIISCLRNSNTDFLHDNKFSLFIHSLGNYYLECMVNNNLLLESQSLLFDNVIINAAAVEQKNHNKWIEQLLFQKNIFIIQNKHDVNLKGLRIFSKHGKQLGEKAKYPLANNAIYFNFSKSVGFRIPTGSSHSYYFGKVPESNKNISLFYFEILHGLIPNIADENRFKIRKELLGDILVK